MGKEILRVFHRSRGGIRSELVSDQNGRQPFNALQWTHNSKLDDNDNNDSKLNDNDNKKLIYNRRLENQKYSLLQTRY